MMMESSMGKVDESDDMVLSVLLNFVAGGFASQDKDLVAPKQSRYTLAHSAEAGFTLGALRADVRLDVGLLDAGTRAEMPLSLAHGGASKEESVRAYIIITYLIRKQRKETVAREGGGVPEGDFMIISSIVRQDPPALVILARAPSVKRRAATSSLGRSKSLMSSVTVPTITAVRPCLSYRCLTSLERETGGLIVLEATSLLRMVLQKLESVLLDRNLKSCAKRKMLNDMSFKNLSSVTYSHEQVLIKILALAVLLILLLNSAPFVQVDTLQKHTQMVSHTALLALSHETPLQTRRPPKKSSHTILPFAYICIK